MTKITREEIGDYVVRVDTEHEKQMLEKGYVYIPLSHIVALIERIVELYGEFYGTGILQYLAETYEEESYYNHKVVKLEYIFPSQKEGFQIVYQFYFDAYLDTYKLKQNKGLRYEILLQHPSKDTISIAGNTGISSESVRNKVKEIIEEVEAMNHLGSIKGKYPFLHEFYVSPYVEKSKERMVTVTDSKHILFYDTEYKSWMKEVEQHMQLIQKKIESAMQKLDDAKRDREKEILGIANEYEIDNQ